MWELYLNDVLPSIYAAPSIQLLLLRSRTGSNPLIVFCHTTFTERLHNTVYTHIQIYMCLYIIHLRHSAFQDPTLFCKLFANRFLYLHTIYKVGHRCFGIPTSRGLNKIMNYNNIMHRKYFTRVHSSVCISKTYIVGCFRHQ